MVKAKVTFLACLGNMQVAELGYRNWDADRAAQLLVQPDCHSAISAVTLRTFHKDDWTEVRLADGSESEVRVGLSLMRYLRGFAQH